MTAHLPSELEIYLENERKVRAAYARLWRAKRAAAKAAAAAKGESE